MKHFLLLPSYGQLHCVLYVSLGVFLYRQDISHATLMRVIVQAFLILCEKYAFVFIHHVATVGKPGHLITTESERRHNQQQMTF